MTKEIRCPYCDGIMRLLVLGLNPNKTYSYECPRCLSRSPFSWNEVTANAMARKRVEKKVEKVG